MKLSNKILLLTVLPVIILGTILYFFASARIRDGIYQQAYKGMHATTLAIRDIFETSGTGLYHLDEKGQLWKGDNLNISQSHDIVDQIKKSTNMEVTIFYKDTRYLTTIVDEKGQRQINTKASDVVVDTVLKNGKTYHADNVDILGTKYIVYYIPLYQPNFYDPIGMAFLGTKQSEVNHIINDMQQYLLIITLILSVLVALIAFVILQRIMKAFSVSVHNVNKIADGHLHISIDQKYKSRKDEIGDMCRSVAKLDSELTGIIGGIKMNSDYLMDASGKLDKTASEAANSISQVDFVIQEIAASANHQAQSTEEAAQDVETMGGMIDDTTQVIEQLNDTTDQMLLASDKAKVTLLELNKSMNRVMDVIDSINIQTYKTNESVVKINDAANLITAIAKQTNLLALNASIEAARAGEHGKGFSVVADEIKNLSKQSNQSAMEIQNMLEQLTNNSNEAVDLMQEAKTTISAQKNELGKTVEAFETVYSGIEQSVNGIHTISKKTDLLDTSRAKTIQVVESLTSIAEENAAGTQEAAASVEEVENLVHEVAQHASGLNEIAEHLKKSIDVFKL